MTRRVIPLLALAAIGCACGLSGEPPPLELSYRDSLFRAGKIVRIENTSERELLEVRVRIEAPNGEERTFTRPSLEPFGSFEIGWKRLGGWEIPSGASVDVQCKGFLRSSTGKVP